MDISKINKGDVLGCIERNWFVHGPVLQIDATNNMVVINTRDGMREFPADLLWPAPDPLPAIIIGQLKKIKELENELRETFRGGDSSFKLLLTICQEATKRNPKIAKQLDFYLQEFDLGEISRALENPEILQEVKATLLEHLERKLRVNPGLIQYKQNERTEMKEA